VKLPAGIATISGQAGQSRKGLTESAKAAEAVNNPIKKYMARMVALLVMVSLHDTQNMIAHCRSVLLLRILDSKLLRPRHVALR
jgi:hypothetical protein